MALAEGARVPAPAVAAPVSMLLIPPRPSPTDGCTRIRARQPLAVLDALAIVRFPRNAGIGADQNKSTGKNGLGLIGQA